MSKNLWRLSQINIMRNKFVKIFRKIFVGATGGAIILLGFIMIPYPGPGWLVVFGGLAVLATEFEVAHDVLDKGKKIYNDWSDWIKKQKIGAQIAVLVVSIVAILLTLWLIDAFGILSHALKLDQAWMISPFFR